MSWLSPENITPSSPNSEAEYLFYMGGYKSVADAQRHVEEQATKHRKAQEAVSRPERDDFALGSDESLCDESDEEYGMRLLMGWGNFASRAEAEEYLNSHELSQDQE